MIITCTIPIAGRKYRGQEIVCEPELFARLLPEPTNDKDPEAVLIQASDGSEIEPGVVAWISVGYIGKPLNSLVFAALQAGADIRIAFLHDNAILLGMEIAGANEALVRPLDHPELGTGDIDWAPSWTEATKDPMTSMLARN